MDIEGASKRRIGGGMIPEGGLSFELWGIPGLVLLFALVEFIKRQWPTLHDRGVVFVSIGVGLLLSLVAELYQVGNGQAVDPVMIEILDTIGAGVIVGLAAGGFFSLTKERTT